MGRHYSISEALVFLFTLLMPIISYAQVETPSEFRVNSFGQAEFIIPISILAALARNERLLELALTYNAKTKYDIGGMGWNLVSICY